ncbi:DUF6816 family protein [Pleurocapsa sp. FMAR1]|uniref:DUF6816 family protein n=1 Tax=Pleurocapsa sp. FMAR1 TaxID=3040204 RepID=UPI0029C84E4C|nr:hypothetical protein [Pleurocapsa sp. FMAR1]
MICTKSLLKILLIFSILFSFADSVSAAPIAERLQQFPQWHNKPPVQLAKGDLEYPEWMAGTWNVESTLVEKIAPLAPEIVTPGFEDNDNYLNQAIAFQVRFGTEYYSPPTGLFSKFNSSQPFVVADRAFNGKKIAQAYLGDDNVYQVKIDPDNPNQQITFLRGERKLISKITGRTKEIPSQEQFIATEVTQQLFRSPQRLYLNEVETTSDYHLLDSGNVSAEQITAIYLSPQDPDYFTAGDRPVALYRYHLDLFKQS